MKCITIREIKNQCKGDEQPEYAKPGSENYTSKKKKNLFKDAFYFLIIFFLYTKQSPLD
jgi:hypothetical protein